jgi:hypothetical protein
MDGIEQLQGFPGLAPDLGLVEGLECVADDLADGRSTLVASAAARARCRR